MFTELAPLVAKSTLLITVAAVKDGRLRLTVTVKTFEDASKPGVPPLAIEGLPAELDSELASVLQNFSTQAVSLSDSLASTLVAMKAIEDASKKELEEKRKQAKGKPKTVGPEATTSGANQEPKEKEHTLFDTPEAGSEPQADTQQS